MFPRAARFDLERSNDVPGPNSYDPSTPEANYKRGAMFERDARFRSAARMSVGSDSVGGGSPNSSSAATPIASSSKVQIDSRIVSLEKERVKLLERSTKAEGKLKEIQLQTSTLSREKKQLQIDNRILQQRLEKSQMKNNQPLQRQNEIQELRLQIQSIESLRSDERLQIEKLTERLAKAERETKAAQELSERLKQKVECTEEELDRSRNEKTEEKEGKSQALLSLKDSQSTIFGLRERLKQMDQDQVKNTSRIAELEEDNIALIQEMEDAIQDSDEEDEEDNDMDQYNDIDRQRSALIAASLRLASENGLLRHTCSQNSIESRYNAIRIRRLEYTLSKKDDEIQNLTEIINNLKSDLAFNESRQIADELIELHAQYRSTNASIARDDPHFGFFSDYDDNTYERVLQQIDDTDVRLTLSQQQIHLEWKQDIIDRLQFELRNSNLREMEWQRTNSQNSEIQARLEITQRNLMELEEAYENSVQQITEAQENEDYWKMQFDQLQFQVESMSKRMQGVEIFDEQIQQASVREQSLLNDRQELLDDLARASNYESAYYTIRAESQKLITRLKEYDIESNVLVNLNSALNSLKNSNQKILYLDRLRTQLDETKLQYRLMEQDRNRLHKQCRELEESLQNVEQKTILPKEDTTVIQKQNDAAQITGKEKEDPIDEREAAKRAWQARPKTRTWRASRQAEGSVRSAPLRERPSRSKLSSSIHASKEEPPILPSYRPVNTFDDSNPSQIPTTTALFDSRFDGAEEISLISSNGTTLIEDNMISSEEIFEAPIKRKFLRAQKSNSSLNDPNRASPVVSLPSEDALAWELDKENLLLKSQLYQENQFSNQNNSIINYV